MAIVIAVLVLILALSFLPSWWVRSVIARHSADRPDFPGTGGEFARHLLSEMKLNNVGVEQTEIGDHYDPDAKMVRLSDQHYNGRSLAAVVIAAHEVGHAMQDATDYAPLRARTRLAKQAAAIQGIATLLLIAAPFLVLLARSPSILFLELGAGLLLIAMTVLMHATTLPVEFDASFNRALPVLQAGRYIPERDMPAARKILRAAAYTYVAAAAVSLLDVMRWIRILRF
ncbi:MAG: zinc metallopeptidase [Pseudomonadota bacterium]